MTDRTGRLQPSLRGLFKLLVSVSLLVLLVSQIDGATILNALLAAKWAGLWVALLLFILGMFVRAYRWQIFLNALNLRIPLRTLTAWYFVGGFFNTVLPTGFGGDAVKAAELARVSGQSGQSIGTVVVDRFLGIVVLLAMGAAALIPAGSSVDRRLALAIAALFAGSVAGFWVLRRQRLMRRIGQHLPHWLRHRRWGRTLYQGLQGYDRQTLARALVVSLFFNITWIALNMILGWALDIQASWIHYLVFVPLVSLSLLLPSVGGLGVRELTYVGLFGLVGVPEEKSFALGILVYAVTVVTGLIGGLIYLIQGLADARS